MGSNVSCSVEIQVSNETSNITLKDPRTFLYNGHSLRTPDTEVLPGSSSTCKFKSTESGGCKGLLAFEAEPFTLAIYFSNPTNHNRFSPKMGLELSLEKVHKGNLEKAYDRLARISRGRKSKEDLMPPSVILKESQETALLNAGPVKVTATMSQGRDTVIRVKMEEQGSSTVDLDSDLFCPEMDLEQFPDKVQEGGPEAANRRLLRTARVDDFPSIVLRELQETAGVSAGPVQLMAAIVRAWEAVMKGKVKKTKSSGREPKARAESPCRARHFQEK